VTGAPKALTATIEALWRIPYPGPPNLLSAPAFTRLRDACMTLYPNAGRKDRLGIPLSNALRAFGVPCGLPPSSGDLSLSPEDAAAQLDVAFGQTDGRRLYLCPLDMADRIMPALRFGPNTIRTYESAELDALVDGPRLRRINPNRQFDTKRFSQFHWLAVEQPFRVNEHVSHRAYSILDEIIGGDWGRIEPHRERFAGPVEAALFAVLLAPWEDWVDSAAIDWLGFSVPWAYQIDNDIFERPQPPPDPDSLTWEPDEVYDPRNEEWIYLGERPVHYSFRPDVEQVTEWLNDETWARLTDARKSPLFETPIAHFFVRAFCAEGVDEFLAHITTIEAALGLQSDFPGATKRMVKRVTTLLGASVDGSDYRHLFDLRSRYLHGRPMDEIAGKDRLLARRLARRVVNEVVSAALKMPKSQSREEYLHSLG
jgi:hypothetical protein